MRFLHTMLRVRNLDDALDFYCHKLGLAEVRVAKVRSAEVCSAEIRIREFGNTKARHYRGIFRPPSIPLLNP